MTCQAFVDLLLDRTIGALPADLDAQAEAHLANCANCRSFAATYQTVPDLVAWALSDPEGLQEAARDALGFELSDADQKAIEAALLDELRKRA